MKAIQHTDDRKSEVEAHSADRPGRAFVIGGLKGYGGWRRRRS